MPSNLYTLQSSNIHKTWALMAGFLVFVVAIAWIFSVALGSSAILYIGVLFALAMNFYSYWHSDTLVIKLTRAVPADPKTYRELHRVVENLAITVGLPKPKVYILNEQQPNAFATGRDPEHAAIAVTTGLLEILDRSELEGVLAHEMAHIGNRDILVSTVAVVLAGFIAIASHFFMRVIWFGGGRGDRGNNGIVVIAGIVAAILAPIAASMIQLALSRRRELLADATGAFTTRYPDGLIHALQKISASDTPMRTASPATAHLFLVSPFKGKNATSWFTKLFMTHPPIAERIKALGGLDMQR